MKLLFKTCLVAITILTLGCESLVDGINENPNQLTLEDIDPGQFLIGAQLSNINIQLGPYSRTAGYYSGQLIGFEQVEQERYLYNVTNSTFDWDGYQSVITPLREIQRRTDNPMYLGITKVVEAHLTGTYTSLFGDMPYSEAVSDVEHPGFDSQREIFDNLQILLQEAIEHLENAAGSVVARDYIFNGDRIKWLESAWTLKARYYMLTKEYDQAYNAAQNGISSHSNSMRFDPLDVSGENSTKNKYFIVLSAGPNTGTGDSYLMQLLDSSNDGSRNHSKTDETARMQYYTIDQNSAQANLGIAHELESQPLITYQENLLILAESGARTQGFDAGLQHLNDLRVFLNTGAFLNSGFTTVEFQYDAYTAEDFDASGIENEDGIDPLRALLREIIEERYVSGFTTFMPFDDARRLRKDDADIAVPFPFNTPTATQHVERYLYPINEMSSNTNAPNDDPGLYTPTEVNQ